MPTLSGRLASILVAACLLTGCQPAVPTPTPVPTYRCTSEAGGAEFDCSQKQYDDMVAKDKLYAEAEAVYRRFLAEEVRILREGWSGEPTQALVETTAGDFLKGVVADLARAKANKVSIESGERQVRVMKRLVGISKGGSVVSISFCVDSRSVHFVRAGKSAGSGTITRDEVYFAPVDSTLKAIGADGQEVAGC